MPLDQSLFSSDLDFIIADLPIMVTIGGTEYSCTKSQLKREQIYTDYGMGDDYEFTIYLNINDLSAIPENHSLVTISEVEYRILNKQSDSADSLLRLHLGNKYGKLD